MPSIYVDGRAFTVAPGQSLLQACLSLGFDLPYFCWHPALGSVGACRQCAVKHFKDEKDERGRLVMACMTPADDGARISIAEPDVVAFRKSVIEGMMLHHPHDCPVCDEGGHCHLQDMTVMTGHNYRRYRFEKRTFRNQYLGPLVNHEMNRCIQCYRCVRFYREYAGGDDLDAFGIRDRVFFGRARDGVLKSEFAGNLAEVCPTGVFTDAVLKRHYTRKWDLRWTPSVCIHCSLGCNTSPGERYGSVRAVVNRYHAEVNGYFLCDRGRFAHEYLSSPRRVRAARWRGAENPPTLAEQHLAELLAAAGPGRIIGFGSPRASLESNFALRDLVGPERFFASQRAGELELAGLVLETLGRGPARTPSLGEIEACDAALVLGEDLTQTAARMALSLRQASRQQPLRAISDPLKIPRWLDHAAREAIQQAHGPLFLATPAPTRLDSLATAAYRAAPDDIARLGFAVSHALDASVGPAAPEWAEAAAAIAAALLQAERPLIIAGASCGSRALIEAAGLLAQLLHARGKPAALSFVVPECNTLGLALLQPRPLRPGMDLALHGHADIAIVLENDLFRRAPADAVEAFLAHFDHPGRHLIVLDQLEHGTAAAAELLLPAASFAEGDGTVVSSEGRAQRFFRVLDPGDRRRHAAIRESWRWLEQAQGRDPDLDDILARFVQAFPELAGVAAAAPSAGFRMAGQKTPRETHRFSGRTAIGADQHVSEPRPPDDPDTPLSFTMEGYSAQPPAPITPFFWSPGWNSAQSVLKYQEEVNAPLRGGDAGVRLLEPAADPAPARPPIRIPQRFARRRGEWLAVRLYHLFGSEELSAQARAISSLAPDAYVALNPEEATAAGLRAGEAVRIQLGTRAYEVKLRILPGLAPGLAGVPAGFAAFDGAELPAWCTIAAARADSPGGG